MAARISLLVVVLVMVIPGCDGKIAQTEQAGSTLRPIEHAKSAGAIRFATFNVSLFRNSAGELINELESGTSRSASEIAEVIQRVRPDVLLLNEFDFDSDLPSGNSQALELFKNKYLEVSQNGHHPIKYEYSFTAPVNTGVDSGLDLDGNGKTGEPNDAFGFGKFPGQYGMAVLSQFPINPDDVRTFQEFLWKDMPAAKWPKKENGDHYFNDQVRGQFRLSSKSHWILPVNIDGQVIHFLAAHPTPPVFDGPEDRNGLRNHDEIRLIVDLIGGADYPVDDQGRAGGLPADANFIVAGDLNADPHDGDSAAGAIRQLLDHPLVDAELIPASQGARNATRSSGKANANHRGNPAQDTADFNDDSTGNLRVDYVLASTNLQVDSAKVFWPAKGHSGHELNDASDHHLVWIDVHTSTEVDSK